MRGVTALVLGVAMLAIGSLAVMAQGATPVSPAPPGDATIATSADGDPNLSPRATRRDTAFQTLQANATVVVTLQDNQLTRLPGGCIIAESASTSVVVCDADGDADGVITLSLPAGEYTLVVSPAPPGYVSGLNASGLLLSAGNTVPVTLELTRGGRDVFVVTVDETDQPVEGACYRLYTDAGGGQRGELASTSCDTPGDGDVGSVRFPGIGPGTYLAVQTRTSVGNALAVDTPFVVQDGGSGPVVVRVVNRPAILPGQLLVNTVDDRGNSLPGACFSVYGDAGGGQRGSLVTSKCDADDGSRDGRVTFAGLSPGGYVLVESQAPEGYIGGAERAVTIQANLDTAVSVVNLPGGSDVTVRTVEVGSGALLVGACFELHRDSGGTPTTSTLVQARCDIADGSDNGITGFTGLAAGDYLLVEAAAPAGYKGRVEPMSLRVDGLTDATITVENRPMTLDERLVEVLKRILRDILG